MPHEQQLPSIPEQLVRRATTVSPTHASGQPRQPSCYADCNIRMYLNGILVGYEIPGALPGEFWGVTNGPFDQVMLTVGSGSGPGTEMFEMDNMVYGNNAPEPATMSLLVLGGLALLRKRRKQ